MWGCCNNDSHQVLAQVRALTDNSGCDRVIEAVGRQEALELAGELTRGRLSIAGYHQDGLRQVNMQLWNWQGFAVAQLDLETGVTVSLTCSWRLPVGCDAVIAATFYSTQGGLALR
jgi:threonine dehydrogenase-like Zn-dependent dehydrogenase